MWRSGSAADKRPLENTEMTFPKVSLSDRMIDSVFPLNLKVNQRVQYLLMSIHPKTKGNTMQEANGASIKRVKAAKRLNLKKQKEQMFETTVKLIFMNSFLCFFLRVYEA